MEIGEKQISDDEKDYLDYFIGKKILCIQDSPVLNYLKGRFIKDKFYEIINIHYDYDNNRRNIGTNRNVIYFYFDGWEMSHQAFFNYFELRTIQDVRKDKIESILK